MSNKSIFPLSKSYDEHDVKNHVKAQAAPPAPQPPQAPPAVLAAKKQLDDISMTLATYKKYVDNYVSGVSYTSEGMESAVYPLVDRLCEVLIPKLQALATSLPPHKKQ